MSAAVENEVCIQFDQSSPTAFIYVTDRQKAEMLIKKGLQPVTTEYYSPESERWVFEIPKQSVRIKVDKHVIKIGGGKAIMPGTPFPQARTEAKEWSE